MRLAFALLLLLLLPACSNHDDAPTPDAGDGLDAGGVEIDAGSNELDAGTLEKVCGEPGARFTTREPLAGCTKVLGTIDFRESVQANLQGLESLREVEGNLLFSDNKSLVGLDELASLTRVGGILQIVGCSSLKTLSGLRSLRSVGSLDIRSNGLLRQSEAEQFAAGLAVQGQKLTQDNGWDVRDSLPDGGSICGDGGSYTRESVVGCVVLRGDLQLRDVFAEDVDDLRDLHEIEGLLNIFRGELTNLDGLGNLERVGGDLLIHSTRLPSLSGLRSLRRVGGKLAISSNGQLPQSEAERLAQSVEVAGAVETSGNGDQLP
ncbi:MAG: hypothetical protein ABW352_23935 [Polyangiales bacterium]